MNSKDKFLPVQDDLSRLNHEKSLQLFGLLKNLDEPNHHTVEIEAGFWDTHYSNRWMNLIGTFYLCNCGSEMSEAKQALKG